MFTFKDITFNNLITCFNQYISFPIKMLTYKSKGIFVQKYFSEQSLTLSPKLEINVTMHKKPTHAMKAVSSIKYSKVIELNSF